MKATTGAPTQNGCKKKAGAFATVCREATTAGTQCTPGTIVAATSTAAGQLESAGKSSGKSGTLEKPATCSRDT